ncbi:dTDP-4-dehydrorhamnose 3,5-epimerase family protein [Nitrincola sp. MINF-07-Sa-05]|uniref:dTDP-4-dehydrorhamnose 3,5-epimerase family protein n=1 Tax=Nitrincola salilacus TaxID=3400273 RepID=UPI00391847E4
MSNFEFISTSLAGVVKVKYSRKVDCRGFLSRLFCIEELSSAGWYSPVAQVNFTKTQSIGTIRGMHFQYPPFAEMKLITCIHGAVWDVALDLRPSSPTFLQWHAETLSDENLTALLIPEGVAHGFQATESETELVYFHSAPYHPNAEAGINPLDPRLAINWPLDVNNLSERDKGLPYINSDFKGVLLK